MDFFDGPAAAAATTPVTTSPGALPVRADIKTQEQLMAESVAAIEARGSAKYEAMQAELARRTSDADAKRAADEDKMRRDAEQELLQHVSTRDAAVAEAKKAHAEAQKQLLKDQKSLEKDGALWELAAMHCDLSKPNSKSQRSTDRMRKIMSSLATEPNVPIGTGKE